MMTHGLLRLIDDGIIRRPVYDWKALQAECLKHANCVPGLELIDGLRRRRGIRSPLPPEHLKRLTDFGVLRRGITVEGNRLRLPNDDSVPNDLDHPDTREALETWRGDSLNGGIIMHGGFFLGPAAFYQRLRELDAELRGKINMTRVNQINDLYGGEELRVLQRRDARFVNTAFTVTLLGAAVSDQLDDGRVLSGVGGQYNFVSQAHELPGARSILMTRAWRERGGEAASNVLFSYAHNTIPGICATS